MPELPEVEVVRLGLEKILKDQPTIKKIELLRKNLRDIMPAKEIKKFEGEKILAVERRAKYLLFKTARGTLLSHLGMTGTWRVASTGDERVHDHIYIHFSNGLRLAYRDPRRFGVFDVIIGEGVNKRLSHLGVEPLSEAFTGEVLWKSLRSKTVALKVAIMDQRIVVGVGNIYASEALFAAKILPTLKANKLSREKARVLVREVRRILTESIAQGGSSISDFAQATGESGYFQRSFKVYDRDKALCVVCKQQIKSRFLGGRNTFWCSHCQK